jgi:hypothetical protein
VIHNYNSYDPNTDDPFAWIDDTGILRLKLPDNGSYYRNVVFDSYIAYRLKPIEGIKVHPRDEFGIHTGDLEDYVDGFKRNWKVVEGGVLYAVGEKRPFVNCMVHYLSRSGRSGISKWDKLFTRLETEGFPKGIIPCMVRFLARSLILYNAPIDLRTSVLWQRIRLYG